MSLEEFSQMKSPRVIKSHAPSNLLLGMSENSDIIPGVKIIVISRNPLDSCVSRYYHAFNPHKLGWTFPAWAALWLSGNSSYGSWFHWVRDWRERSRRNLDQILWVQYEDMKKNPREEIEKIRLFLNIASDDDRLVQRVFEGSTFDSMKKQSMKESSKERSGDFLGHLRKGIAGDWRNHFTDEIKKEFIDKFDRELEGTGLVYDFGVAV